MILLTELATRQEAPRAIAYRGAVHWYSFGGDATYIDDEAVEFYWANRQEVTEVRGYWLGGTPYIPVLSVALCLSTVRSFYWDEANQRLYIHHEEHENDYVFDHARTRMLRATKGFATGRLPDQHNYFPDFFFSPTIRSIGSLEKRVDPLRFGLLSFESSDYSIENSDGSQDTITLQEALNSQVIFVLMRPGQTDINDGQRVFTGVTDGSSRGDEEVRVRLAESRLFFNRAACPSVFDATTYPSIDSKFVGKRIPVAYGTIRKGVAVPIDSDGVETGDAATITFKLADDSLHAIGSVTALYDSNGDSVTLGTVDLTACTVQYSKAAGKEVDLSRFTWAGSGYVIDGDDDNGLDIMRDVFENQAVTAYSEATFQTAEWEAAQTENAQSIGLSYQGTKGLVEAVVEPITVSLQGIVDVLGDGRLTFRNRDTTAPAVRRIEQRQIIEGPRIDVNTEAVVSRIQVNYAPSAVDPDDVLSVYRDADANDIEGEYGIDRLDPVSPIETVLVDEADAISVAAEVATTTTDPETIVELTVTLDSGDVRLFDIVEIDIGRPRSTDWRAFEALGRGVSFQSNAHRLSIVGREIVGREVEEEPEILLTEALAAIRTEAGEPLYV